MSLRLQAWPGTIYLYFKNKEDLLLSIFEEKMEMLLGMLNSKLADRVSAGQDSRA